MLRGRLLGPAALLGVAVAGVARKLYGRPTVSPFHVVELAAILAFVVWGARRLLVGRLGYLCFFAIALLALWEGVELAPTLIRGFTLAAVPGFVARTSAALCLGAGVGLLPFVFRLVRRISGATERSVAAATARRDPDPVPRLTATGR